MVLNSSLRCEAPRFQTTLPPLPADRVPLVCRAIPQCVRPQGQEEGADPWGQVSTHSQVLRQPHQQRPHVFFSLFCLWRKGM